MANQISKLSYVDAKLGAPTGGQQTTRYIYDTIKPGVGTGGFFQFFQNFSNKSVFETNLTTNKLDSAESMVIKSLFITQNVGTGGFVDLGQNFLVNVYVGNQCVLKDFDFSYNSKGSGLALDRLHNSVGSGDNVEVRLLTDIVIPPQVAFKVTLQANPGWNTAAETSFTLGMRGYGKIFSAGMSF